MAWTGTYIALLYSNWELKVLFYHKFHSANHTHIHPSAERPHTTSDSQIDVQTEVAEDQTPSEW